MRTLTFHRIIGSGAMGTVYQAELRVPRGFVRPCAVKVMNAAGPDREHFMARMRDEARLLGMLQDEQVLGVSELVLVDGRDAVIMEYVEGVDLTDLIRNHRVPPRALAELGAEVAGVLYRAHNARHPQSGEPLNVIHRDVKPANVMVTSRGGVRLLDFGVARAAFSSRESHTQGLVLGTLNYFPPEVLAGEEPTPAVDVYGLGLTLWECATGKEWGAPRVQFERFERRVEQRLAEIADEYRALIPVLRQILQWDPKLRPDGGVVERALLHAADGAAGEGLRTWSRKVVPQILEQKKQHGTKDGLVARTVALQSPGGAPASPGPVALEPLPDPPRNRPPPMPTFNDLGPPSASVREPARAMPEPEPMPRPPVSDPKPGEVPIPQPRKRRRKKPAKPSGPPSWVLALIGAALAMIVVLVFLFVLVLVVWAVAL